MISKNTPVIEPSSSSLSLVDAHVGMRLRLFRMKRGWSQTVLAKKIGISYQQVQKYESGKNRIGAGRLWQLCQIFEIDPNTLFEGLKNTNDSSQPEASDDPKMSLLSKRQNYRLLSCFTEIEDSEARGAIVSLCEALKEKGN